MQTLHLTLWQIIVLALIQGVTELFPISSLGHSVIIPGLLGWSQFATDTGCGGSGCFVPIVVAFHIGTSLALLLFFWRDWLRVVRTLFQSIKDGEVQVGTDSWVSWLIIIGCIPAGLLGVFLETPLKHLFTSPFVAA